MATRPDDASATSRSEAAVAAELAAVERYLLEAPPHSSGDRGQLESRRTALQRELAAARRSGRDEDR